MRRAWLIGLFPLLLPALSGTGKAQSMTTGPCVYFGGYPWQPGGCLRAADLNQAIADARALPNTLAFSALFNLPTTLAGHGITNGLRTDLNLSDVSNPLQAVPNLETLSLVTATGTISVTSLHTVWQPGSQVATTFNLPATPLTRDRRTLQNQSSGAAPMTVAGNGSQILTSGGSLSSVVLPNKGDFAEFEYIGSATWVVR